MKQLKKWTCTLLMLLVLSCGSTAVLSCVTAPMTANAFKIASITKINKKKLTLNKGETYQLKIVGTKKKVTWKSNKPIVVKVNSKGKVTAKKAGTAKITAKVNGKKYICTVTVKDKKPSNPTPQETEKPSTPIPSEPDTPETGEKSEDQIRPEFKEAMDSYEAFFDEYVDFMKKYQESGSPISMLVDYTNYLTKYTDMMGKMNKLGEDDLTTAELAYYIEVTGRITQKLLEVA